MILFSFTLTSYTGTGSEICAKLIIDLTMASLPIFNPQIPILADIHGGMRTGLMVRIKGQIQGYFGR